MEDRAPEKQSSYTYWVREATEDVAPRPVPRKLSAADLSKQPRPAVLGSVWNQACCFPLISIRLGSFSLNVFIFFVVPSWMSSHLFCTLFAASSLSQWLASVLQAGTWEERNLNSWASNRIKIQVRLSGDEDLSTDDKMKICNDLRLYLAPIRKKLEVFEQELRDR
ncbi:hypothetical protein GW17_00009922 [Ensete ventricosum]|nr:hypothetical protein GW17_00009922 [Ensete ventricosum]